MPAVIHSLIPQDDDAVAFYSSCMDLTNRVRKAITANAPLLPLLETNSDSVYIKAADGTMLVCNRGYINLFAPGTDPTGRSTAAYLNEDLVTAARSSDLLVLSGADDVMFIHPYHDTKGHSLSLRTFKGSLLGLGHPRHAIIGISRLIGVNVSERRERLLPLGRSWAIYETLKQRDQEIAVWVARGERIKAIAENFHVSEKTIENSRNSTMKALHLGNPVDLIKLMVRLQDGGFADFGL
ncbi:Bacterial regulatory protein, luxR family [Rubripirellula lacrimiformis]|uniref:Bacterial regulatory protein, luxR family n=1 Tax=Rubripirellula lacrimiformis TaxID=1930273 RepID=A0A517NF79_9BACT|nr:PAS and helix-turn-helix domain-containing protein [Rubripirellula lacrimiformis]QDT05789.1 Bacterial regulatory protein, luxR family [Rubripirellula lacrimiformis]